MEREWPPSDADFLIWLYEAGLQPGGSSGPTDDPAMVSLDSLEILEVLEIVETSYGIPGESIGHVAIETVSELYAAATVAARESNRNSIAP